MTGSRSGWPFIHWIGADRTGQAGGDPLCLTEPRKVRLVGTGTGPGRQFRRGKGGGLEEGSVHTSAVLCLGTI